MEDESINGISRKAFEQYNKVQMSGVVNMNEISNVELIASKVGFLELWKLCKSRKYLVLQESYELAMEKGWVDIMKDIDPETKQKLRDAIGK